eukprot:3501729-Rhodomonas_salina.1
MEVARANPDLRDLESLIGGISLACKTIANLVDRATITGMVGYEGGGGSVNVQGEEQKKLDVVTNDVLKRALTFTGKVSIVTGQSRLGENPLWLGCESSVKGSKLRTENERRVPN